MIYDLHCHSNQSDGILSPEQLVSRAKINNVSVLALTDHDTVSGIAPAQHQAAIEGIVLITGIEFSSQWQGRGIHIVGLNIDLESPELLHALAHQQQVRHERAHQISHRLAQEGMTNAFEGAMVFAGEGTVGRPHFARWMIEKGYVANINQAFKRYLGAGKIGDVKQNWPDFAQIIAWIVGSGGVAVLAHPAKYKMTRTKLCVMVQDFAASGGHALEVMCGRQTPDVTADCVKIANKFDLFSSCGSDFHIPGHQWQELGCGGTLPAGARPVWQLWH